LALNLDLNSLKEVLGKEFDVSAVRHMSVSERLHLIDRLLEFLANSPKVKQLRLAEINAR